MIWAQDHENFIMKDTQQNTDAQNSSSIAAQ